ncbi:PREDICTED: putative clathrin assembly protein At4g02650 [Nelumbo nucifera]|uniref:Clathrin assembly protein At4g02650 n=1 Tax=Nelumbo nucifera TaxID=4432 RepID=A0A1U8ARE4_NELNU|nr:PREDICTED: putative clathrin assembly protein At4g02650 [Nelumbo nucifera]
MAPSKIRRTLDAVKDRTSIGLAKVSSSHSLAELDVAVIKATRHDEHPADDKHVREILSFTSYSRAYITACVNMLSRRLSKTKNWTVALKTLILIHRLLCEGDPAYEQEIFFCTRHGTRLLNLSDFRDASKSNSWDFSAFVRTFALYLDERLEYRMHGGRRVRRKAFRADEDNEEDSPPPPVCTTPVHEMNTEQIFARVQNLMQLLERFLACRPTGKAKNNRLVVVALYPILKESFQIYYDIAEVMAILVDRFMELAVADCVKVHGIFTRLSKQFDQLDIFYNWSKSTGIARSSECPKVERILPKKLQLMDDFIRDKSIMSQRTPKKQDLETLIVEDQRVHAAEVVENLTRIKALPPPEHFSEIKIEEVKVKEEVERKEKVTEKSNPQQEADLLNLWDDADAAVASEEHGEKLALALFDGTAASPAVPAWGGFTLGGSADWETELVESASNLSNHKLELGGGFDMLMLDGMYRQQKTAYAPTTMGNYGAAGSASSVVLASSGKPPMLALLPPPNSCNGATEVYGDPFAASLSVPPPPYVQISEMEKKQRLLAEEQFMWQQYARDGMQGQLGLEKLQMNPYNMGGYNYAYIY